MTAIGFLLSLIGIGSPSALAGPTSERAVAGPISLTSPSEIPNPACPPLYLTAGIDHGQPTLALAGSCPRGSLKHDWGTSITAPTESPAICIRLAATTDALRATPIPGPDTAILADEAFTLSRDAPTHKLVGIGGGATVPGPVAIVLQLADGYSWSSGGSRLRAYHYAVDLHLNVPQLAPEFAKRQPLVPATQQISVDSLVAAVGRMLPSPDNAGAPVMPFATPPSIELSTLSPAGEGSGEQTRRSSANLDQTGPQRLQGAFADLAAAQPHDMADIPLGTPKAAAQTVYGPLLVGWQLRGAVSGRAWVIAPDSPGLGLQGIAMGRDYPIIGTVSTIFANGDTWYVQTSHGWMTGQADPR